MGYLSDTEPILVNGTTKVDVHSGTTTKEVCFLTDSVISAALDANGDPAITGTLSGQTFPAGLKIDLNITSITLTSGSVLLMF